MCFALFIAAGSFFSIRERVATIVPEPFTTGPMRALPRRGHTSERPGHDSIRIRFSIRLQQDHPEVHRGHAWVAMPLRTELAAWQPALHAEQVSLADVLKEE